MKIAVLSPIAWRTPPRHYGPWEQIASGIADGLVEKGMDVSLFATKDSITDAKLDAVISRGYEEDKEQDTKVSECLHISNLMEKANSFDIIHNHFDFLPLTYSGLISTPMVTTIHGFSSPKIIPVFKKYNNNHNNFYVSISNADRSPELSYLATVYNGIDKKDFSFKDSPDDYLLFFGRIHGDKGTREAIDIAKKAKRKLIISGIIQDQGYFDQYVAPVVNNDILYVGISGPEKRNELLGNACALLHPINFNEPFGLSVAEAMMCGTPVIAFNKGSMSELILEGKTGFLVNTVDEAVEKIKSLKQIDRRYCRRWAEKKFGKAQMVDNYLNVYKKVLAIRSNI